MRDIFTIFRRNLISPIVIAILVLSTTLLLLGDTRDAWFLSVVILINTSLAIVQEVRAKLALKKLELLSAPIARRLLNDGKYEDVPFDSLVVDDLISVKLGDEVPADGVVVASEGLEVDESILTGESKALSKPVKSLVCSASSVVAGSATVRITAIGADTMVGKMTSKLKRYKPELTPMQHSISRTIGWLTYGALGLSALIFVVYMLANQNPILIFKTIASAAIVIVPEGLLLASSLLLAYGSLKLAEAKVLPQKLSAIESMALLDVLCVDKTGTLTSDNIVFESLELFDKDEPHIDDLVAIIAKDTSGGSLTGKAINNVLHVPKKYKIIQTMPFSSSRKMSGMTVSIDSKQYTALAGAPEYVGSLAPMSKTQLKRFNQLTSEGKRVMLVAVFDNVKGSIMSLKDNSGRAVGLIVLSNELREGVESTIKFFKKNNVSIRVISGDNANTVRYVAMAAGIENADVVLTGAELAKVKKRDWDNVIAKTAVFARVLPDQKERIISTFKRLGNYTGMVGDGVNDALAVKESDLGVAMFDGATATRRVADIVLLDNSFTSFPLGMRLGNRIMQAIELIATLFFHKIIFGIVLLLSTLVATAMFGFTYPFEPRHITFMNIFMVSLPTVMWTLFPPSPRRRLSPKHFWNDTLWAVAPIATLSGIVITGSYLWLRALHPNDVSGVSTLTVVIATFFGIYLVYLVPRMFDVRNNRKAQIARLLYSVAVIGITIPSFGLGIARDFFNFSMPNSFNSWGLIVVILLTAWIQWYIAGRAGERLKSRDQQIAKQ